MKTMPNPRKLASVFLFLSSTEPFVENLSAVLHFVLAS
jgi:hypothetical protein